MQPKLHSKIAGYRTTMCDDKLDISAHPWLCANIIGVLLYLHVQVVLQVHEVHILSELNFQILGDAKITPKSSDIAYQSDEASPNIARLVVEMLASCKCNYTVVVELCYHKTEQGHFSRPLACH